MDLDGTAPSEVAPSWSTLPVFLYVHVLFVLSETDNLLVKVNSSLNLSRDM